MDYRSSPIPRIRTIKALRGEALKIDLGKEYQGTLTAWMKREPNDLEYRSFDIVDNRYLYLTKSKASDYVEGGEVTSEIAGKWYFDVEQDIEGEDTKTVIYGTILFQNDITGSLGAEEVPPPGNHYRTIDISVYLPSEESLSGTAETQSDANKEFVNQINEITADSETITTENATVYDDTEVYDSGNVFVSYVNESATEEIFQTAALYRSRKDTVAGVSPEDSLYDKDTNPTGKWEYQGASVTVSSGNTSNTIVTDLSALAALVEYNDTDSVFVISENAWHKFYVDDNTGVQANDFDSTENPGSWKEEQKLSTSIGTAFHNVTEKTTPVNADEIGIWDSVSSALGKVTWANIKATLKAYFDTIYQTVLVSGTNIKTVNSESILGSGNIDTGGGLASTWENNITEIRAITEYSTGIDVGNYATGIIYQFDETSTAADDGVNVLKPDNIASGDPGRWVNKIDFVEKAETFNEGTLKKFDVNGNDADSGLTGESLDIYDLSSTVINELTNESNWVDGSGNPILTPVNLSGGIKGQRYYSNEYLFECVSDFNWRRTFTGRPVTEIYNNPNLTLTDKTNLENTANWSAKAYIGPAISDVAPGTRYYDNDYVFEFVQTNLPIRYARI